MTTKELKIEIRKLKKLKLACKAGSVERIDLHRQIKELRAKLNQTQEISKEKEQLIFDIQKADPIFERMGIDLNKFSKDELTFHLKKIEKARAEERG